MLLFFLLLPGIQRILSLRQGESRSQVRRLYRRLAWLLGGIVLASMAAQEAILYFAGQLTWANALPLHLCSLMGLILLPTLLSGSDTLLHALLLIGLPGAELALYFPAIADTPWPELTGFFFRLMHTGVSLGPLLPIALGWRPRLRGVAKAGLFLLGAGLAAMAANALTGGNYLFLAGPVAGTPLMWLARWGTSVYRLLLTLLAAILLAGEALLLRFFMHR